ncbi:MAG TPA: RNA-binding S4 domain-containing protein [Acidisarcina sp.]
MALGGERLLAWVPEVTRLDGRLENNGMTGVRMDKWLWAARFFKTRSLAAGACELGRVDSNGQRAKAAREVRVGDQLRIRNEGGEFAVEVLSLSEVRGPAAVAQTLFRETDESRALRLRAAEERKEMLRAGGATEGRPSKRDRQQLARLRGRIHPFR